jgi:antitoxin component YwqK of YwqJK toxin-antitoxin module
MKYLKLLFKIAIGLFVLFIILIIVLLSGESYETITKKDGNEIVIVEIKNLFGRKISECPINSNGFYHGSSKSWDIFTHTLRSEGDFNNGYWHGRWKDYDRDGQLIMIREWNMGELNKVFIPVGANFKELSKNEWPKYVDVKQSSPQRVHE